MIRFWTVGRKEDVVLKVRAHIMTLAEACHVHDISEEELRGWIESYRHHGRAGLRATRKKARAA